MDRTPTRHHTVFDLYRRKWTDTYNRAHEFNEVGGGKVEKEEENVSIVFCVQ